MFLFRKLSLGKSERMQDNLCYGLLLLSEEFSLIQHLLLLISAAEYLNVQYLDNLRTKMGLTSPRLRHKFHYVVWATYGRSVI